MFHDGDDPTSEQSETTSLSLDIPHGVKPGSGTVVIGGETDDGNGHRETPEDE